VKIIIILICVMTLLASTGCAVWGGRTRADNQELRQHEAMVEHSSGVDHGEYPGDMNQDEDQ
jgi:hypothetical protein